MQSNLIRRPSDVVCLTEEGRKSVNPTGRQEVQPPPHREHAYEETDRVMLAGQSFATFRPAIPYINVPGPGQTWQELNQWREAYGLRPVAPA